MKVSHILVPVDGSERADRALAIACALARGARVSLIHVPMADKGPMDLAQIPAYGRLDDAARERITKSQEVAVAPVAFGAGPVPVALPDDVLRALGDLILNDARDAAKAAGVEAATATAEGDPATAILDYAEAHGVDLIVLGSRGLGAFRGMLFGGTSQKVAREAKCPCVSVT